MVRGICDVLELENRAQGGERPQRLQVAWPRVQILAGFGVQRRVEAAEPRQVRGFAAYVRHLEHDGAREFTLEAGVPLLDVGWRGVRVESKVAGQTGAGSARETIARGQQGKPGATRAVDLVAAPVQNEFVALQCDSGAE